MDKILTVEIAEGLGNQLFMYAHAYALSKKLGYELKIDNLSGFSKKKNKLRSHQKYMLDHFNIIQNLADTNNMYENHFKRIKKKIELFFENFKYKKKFIIEKNVKINNNKTALPIIIPNDNNLSSFLYVQGNFENEVYFNLFKDDLIEMYKPLKKFINYDNETINQLKNTNSVSIHVRKNKFSDQPHEIINNEKLTKSENFTNDILDYIYKSIVYFEKKINNPTFFIWSNDIESISNNFKGKKFVYVKGNDVINDFNLFSYAKHFIVGGSTFHWWGAYLNTNPDKICVYPSKLNPSGNPHFYPSNWTKI